VHLAAKLTIGNYRIFIITNDYYRCQVTLTIVCNQTWTVLQLLTVTIPHFERKTTAMEDMITAEQGIKLYAEVGLSANTFYRNAREGKIRKSLPKGRQRDALYYAEDIRNITELYRKKRKSRLELRRNQKEEHGVTDWAKSGDLPYLLTLDYEMFGIEETVDLSITHAWFKKNPYMCRVIYNEADRKDMWGYLTMVPLKEETILKLLKREMHERDIQTEDILTYEEGKAYSVYVNGVVIKPQYHVYLRTLVNSLFNFWCDQYPKIRIEKIFAYAYSEEGWNLIKQLFFAPRYDIGERAFELDPMLKNPSKLITAFQDCINEKQANIESEARKH